MILDFWKKSVENSKLNSKLRYQFTMRVLGRSPRRRGCGEDTSRYTSVKACFGTCVATRD